eukprot:jgi/Tetstr1/430763/TSEL_020548.t1
MASEEVELTDVSNSEAFKVLEEMVAAGEIDADKADAARAKYSAIHDAFVKAMTGETALLEKAKSLKSELDKEQGGEEEDRDSEMAGMSSSMQIAALKDDAEQARAEYALCEEREQLLQLEVLDLQRQRNELQSVLDKANEEHRAALAPQIASLTTDIQMLEVEINVESAKLTEAQSEVDRLKGSHSGLLEEIGQLQSSRSAEAGELQKASLKPEKIRRQGDILVNALKGLNAQQENVSAKLIEVDNALHASTAKKEELQTEHARSLAALDRGRVQNETKERNIDDIHKDLELASIDSDQLLANRVNLDMQIKGMQSDLKREMDILARGIKDKDNALRKYRKMELSLTVLEDQIPPLRIGRDRLTGEKNQIVADEKRAKRELTEVKREVDIHMSGYLKEEAIGKDKAEMFAVSFEELNELEAEVARCRAEEQERLMVIKELQSKRDNVARGVSGKVRRMKDAQELVKTKEIVGWDLKKAHKEAARRVTDFQQLYELVKNQRNKFVNLIQAANQSCAEMKEKLKILGNEVEILRNESVEKDKLLGKERTDHSATIGQRDQLRADLNKCSVTFRKKQDIVDEQIAEIDKLNAIINGAEKEMLRLKKQYETVVESRNFTGIMLIDRNDELCILYEKANIQEEVQTQGDMAIYKLEDEIRILRLECREVERSIEVTRRLLPRIPVLDEDVALLQKELLEAKRESEKLSLQLEDPENKGRWRRLEGKIPTGEELQAKLSQLEERLNDKKEQLLEKELILEEITSLSDRLRQQAAEGRADTLELAKKVNDYQARIRAVTRKLMATISELSMYQATGIKLSAERDELADDVSTAAARLEAGEAPTADAEREWFRREREQVTLALMRQAAEEAQSVADAAGDTVETTAETRPNAYIPEDIGIPKPYGSYAPFKPQEPGATMRHIRKPQPKEVVI